MNEFAGRVIEGDITASAAEMKPQHDEAEFTDALNAALEVKGVESVRWQQYTPYFNDGDPCVFRISGDVKYLPVDGDEEAGEEEDGFLDVWDISDDSPLQPIRAFEKVIDSGHHDRLLVTKFGDHAQITATKEKFTVDFYDHD